MPLMFTAGLATKTYAGRAFGRDKSWQKSPSRNPPTPGEREPPIDKNSYMGNISVLDKI